MPHWGGDIRIKFDDIYYYLKPTEGQVKSWDDVPERDQEHLRPAGHSRGRKEVPGRREGPVRERSRLRLAEGRDGPAGRDLHRHRFGPPRAFRPAARVLRHDHPAGRQQVRRAQFGGLVGRVVRLRAAGREGRVPLAGLLPHQRGEHGPVRADADYRRRGRPGPLRRRLHRPDVLRPKASTRPWSK